MFERRGAQDEDAALRRVGAEMRALVFDGHEMAVTDRLEVRDPRRDEVRVRLTNAGVCHTDVLTMEMARQHGNLPTLAVLGHEGAGVVEAVGADVSTVSVGDHVVISTVASCGRCSACSTGRPVLCKQNIPRPSTPFTLDGAEVWSVNNTSAFAEEVVVREVQAIRIPSSVPLSSACVIGCAVITGVGTVFNRTRVRRGDVVAVFGMGGVGLNVVQGCRLAGASRIIAVDVARGKEQIARMFGASDFVDAGQVDPVDQIRELLGVSAGGLELPADGVEWAFDCVGKPNILRSCFEITGWGGTAVALGAPPFDADVSLHNFSLVRDRAVVGCAYGAARPHHDMPLIAELYLRGELLLDELVTRTYPLERFDDLLADLKRGELARGVLTFARGQA